MFRYIKSLFSADKKESVQSDIVASDDMVYIAQFTDATVNIIGCQLLLAAESIDEIDDWSLGYIFGYHTRCLAQNNITDEVKILASITNVFISLYISRNKQVGEIESLSEVGSKVGTLIRKCLDVTQYSSVYSDGNIAGQKDLDQLRATGKPILGLYNYLVKKNKFKT